MQPVTVPPPEAGGRLLREKVYWDQVYSREGDGSPSYSWMKFVEDRTYIAELFQALLTPLSRRRLLSIGGGVDRLGISLAEEGHRVVCVDVSPEASARTRELADRAGVSDRLTALAAGC
jgi:cyclopropane fatty-acyl-phospholipid synthase-like methyltransferase